MVLSRGGPPSDPSPGSAPATGRPGPRPLADAAAILPAVLPMGVAFGVALVAVAPGLAAWLSAPTMVAGSAQMALLTRLDDGSHLAGALLAALVVGARFVVYSAALATRFARPRWFRWLGPALVVDQTYALVVRAGPALDDVDEFRRYYLRAGGVLWLGWTTSVAVGVVLGPTVAGGVPADAVIMAMFLALVVPGLSGRADVAAVVAGAAVVASGLAPASASHLVAAVAGLAAARMAEVRS